MRAQEIQKSGERTFCGAGTNSRCSKEGTSLATHYSGKFLNFTAVSCFICAYPCFTFQLRPQVRRSQLHIILVILHRISSQGHKKVFIKCLDDGESCGFVLLSAGRRRT